MLKFFWNGIKENGGRIQKAGYSLGGLTNYPESTITIYAKRYLPLSAGIKKAFTIENGTDMMVDYFEKDRIRVTSDHPLYKQVRTAYEAQEAHNAKRWAKHVERQAA